MQNRILVSALFLVVFGNTAFIANAFAITKVTPCKIGKKRVCVPIRKVPSSLRTVVPERGGVLTPLQEFPIVAGDFQEFPKQDGETTTGIKVPAGTHTQTVCMITLVGEYKCIVLTAFNDCPGSIPLQDEGSGITYECELDCDNRRPGGDADSEGNCDCDIRQDTCKPLGR